MNEHEREEPSRAATSQAQLGQLAWVFLKLGVIAFGGPAAHIAVGARNHPGQWVPSSRFPANAF